MVVIMEFIHFILIYLEKLIQFYAIQLALVVKNLDTKAGDTEDVGSSIGSKVEKMPWRWAWQPTLVFLPGKSPWTEKPGRL